MALPRSSSQLQPVADRGRSPNARDIFLRVETLPATLVRKWLAQAVSWDRPAAYIEHLQSLKLGPNVAPLLGHSALRATVMGLERSLGEPATPTELERMKRLRSLPLKQAASAFRWIWSTGIR